MEKDRRKINKYIRERLTNRGETEITWYSYVRKIKQVKNRLASRREGSTNRRKGSVNSLETSNPKERSF